MWPARGCAFKQSATPSVEIAAALASTMARRSPKVVAAVGPSPAFASVTSRAAPRAKTACDSQARATAPVSRRLLAGLREPQARRPPLLMKRCESAKQRGRRLRLFALKPSQNKDANFKCLRLALKLLQRWPQLWPNARSKSLQPSAPRRPS